MGGGRRGWWSAGDAAQGEKGRSTHVGRVVLEVLVVEVKESVLLLEVDEAVEGRRQRGRGAVGEWED